MKRKNKVPAIDPKDAASIARNPDVAAEQLASVAGVSATVDRLLAKHPNASTDLLEKLSHSSDKATRKYVVLNANASKEALMKLAPQFPGDFFKNPAFDWLLLEDPDLLVNLGQGVLKNILKRPECPVSLMNWAVEHGGEQEKLAVAMNPNTSVPLLQRLTSFGGEFASAARAHEALADEGESPGDSNSQDLDSIFDGALRQSLREVTGDEAKSSWTSGTLGQGQWCDLGFAARLDAIGLPLGAVMPILLPENAESLANDRDVRVRRWIAADPVTPDAVIDLLAQDTDDEVRSSAERRRLPMPTKSSSDVSDRGTWKAKSTAKGLAARLSVARNPAAPPELLQSLASGAESPIWKALAFNPSSPVELKKEAFKTLIGEASDFKMLEGLAAAPECPLVQRQMASSKIWWIQVTRIAVPLVEVQDRPRAEELVANHREECLALLKRPQASIIAKLLKAAQFDVTDISEGHALAAARSPVPAVRVLGLVHRLADLKALASNSKATNWLFRLAVARNTSSPGNLLDLLTKDADRRVAAQAQQTIENKHDARQRKDQVIATSDGAVPLGSVVNEAVKRISSASGRSANGPLLPWYLQGTVWWNFLPMSERLGTGTFAKPVTTPMPKELAALLARHPDGAVRCFVARNPNTPMSVLEDLVGDEEGRVRWSAGMNQRTPAELRERLAKEFVTEARGEINFEVETDSTLPFEMLKAIAKSLDARHSYLGRNPAVPESLLKSLDREEVARNPSAPMKWLLKWARDPELKADVAANPSMPLETLMGWAAENDDELVRAGLAENPSLPFSVLMGFAQDADRYVRSCVARNSAAPLDLLRILAADNEAPVRRAVAENSATSWQLLKGLQEDSSSFVSSAVTFELIRNRFLCAAISAAADEGTPSDELIAASKGGAWSVRLTAAQNPSFPAWLRESTIAEISREIEERADPTVQALDPASLAPADLAPVMCALDLMPEQGNAAGIVRAAKSADWMARVASALHDRIQPSLLRMLIDDKVEVVKQLAIRRLKTVEAT